MKSTLRSRRSTGRARALVSVMLALLKVMGRMRPRAEAELYNRQPE